MAITSDRNKIKTRNQRCFVLYLNLVNLSQYWYDVTLMQSQVCDVINCNMQIIKLSRKPLEIEQKGAQFRPQGYLAWPVSREKCPKRVMPRGGVKLHPNRKLSLYDRKWSTDAIYPNLSAVRPILNVLDQNYCIIAHTKHEKCHISETVRDRAKRSSISTLWVLL